MISDYINIGTKIDIVPDNPDSMKDDEFSTVFYSKVQDFFPNGDLEIDMPTVNSNLILLHNSMRYRMVFYTDKATYIATAEVVDRYKSNNMFLLRVRLISQLERFQRREYFRCDCILDINFCSITEQEAESFDLTSALQEEITRENLMWYNDGVALDISGGGMRFTSRQKTEPGSYVRLIFTLPINEQYREFKIVANVLSCSPLEESTVRFENRVQFVHISGEEREAIIRYIFEQERKSRKLGRG